jgi:subtilase family serine protease
VATRGGGKVSVEDKTAILIGIILVSIVSLVQVAGAIYSFDGVPYPDKLDEVAHGTLKGGVYVGESRGLGFTPYEQTFELPEKVTVKWARLYVGVWGGTERYEGWVYTTFNEHDLGKTSLRGVNDDNSHVYCSSHGSYWGYYNVTDMVVPGLNVGIADTSRGERGNKLDGRVYGIILVVIYEDKNGAEVSYWVSDGNPSLHGKGWAGAVPSINDFVSVDFSGDITPANVKAAHLTVTYLAGNEGEPDYLEFNGHEVGGTDVANNADGETYGIDLKTLDVTRYIQAENSLLFLRGKDINGDGIIDVDDEGNLEGEYYFHPVLAVLAVEHKTPEKTAPDFTVQLEFGNLTEGENILQAVVNNYGRLYEGEVRLAVLVDNLEVYSDVMRMDASGIKQGAIPWNATHGTHTITANVDTENAVPESNENNNIFSSDAHIGGNPDLSVKILAPVRAETRAAAATSSSIVAGGGLIAILSSLLFLSRRSKKARFPGVLLILVVLSVALVLSGCIDKQPADEENTVGSMLSYSVPVELKNEGEKPALDFELALYVDGEKSVIKKIDALEGGVSVIQELPIVVEEGTHSLKAVVDETNAIKDARRDNNVDEITFDF